METICLAAAEPCQPTIYGKKVALMKKTDIRVIVKFQVTNWYSPYPPTAIAATPIAAGDAIIAVPPIATL